MIPYIVDGGFGWVRCAVKYSDEELLQGLANETDRQINDWISNAEGHFIESLDSAFEFYRHIGFDNAPIACVSRSAGWAGIVDFTNSSMSEAQIAHAHGHPFDIPYKWEKISAAEASEKIKVLVAG